MAKAKLNILYAEGESDLLTQQSAALQKAGHQVQQAIGRKGVEEVLTKGSFDLVVLGGTLTRNERHHLVYMIKKAHAGTKVLVLHTDGTRHPYVDACVDTGSDTEHVLARIDSMNLGVVAKAKAAGA